VSSSLLARKNLVIIFAYAPAGLGHLRVTDALYHGLPAGITPVLLGAQDKAISWQHRLLSINPILRALFQWGQIGFRAVVFAYLYKQFFHMNTTLLYQQTTTVLDERIDVPSEILIVATHFGLAQEFAWIKKRLEKEKEVKVHLVVQVTDDSPQPFWYVEGVDMSFVPSQRTKKELSSFGKRFHLLPLDFQVIPYPITPALCESLSSYQHQERLRQLSSESRAEVHVSIPISGAAVGTMYTKNLIDALHSSSPRFFFHIVVKEAAYTKDFIADVAPKPYVRLLVSTHDRGTVNNYEKLFESHILSLEITKPSEQTFKALLRPSQKGGVILLFSNPVGVQEYDNIDFLRRNHLFPTKTQQLYLFEKAEKNQPLLSENEKELLHHARMWRALMLPSDPKIAASFICWCHEQGIFEQMGKFHDPTKESEELGSNGVAQFWQKVENFLDKS